MMLRTPLIEVNTAADAANALDRIFSNGNDITKVNTAADAAHVLDKVFSNSNDTKGKYSG